MAEKNKKRPAHSGFEGKTIGELAPKGMKFKHNADGTSTPIYPKGTEKKQTKKK